MRRAEDLLDSAQSQWTARYSGFLSDREQDLCAAALSRCGCDWYRFEGGWPDAERRVLALEPQEGAEGPGIVCLQLECGKNDAPAHKDYLGSLMGLSIQRTGLGDIVLDPQHPGRAYVFALPPVAQLIQRELTSVGRASVRVSACEAAQVEQLAAQNRKQLTADGSHACHDYSF